MRAIELRMLDHPDLAELSEAPERSASVRALEKLGFRWDGDVQDPEDGPVWRWVWPVLVSA